MRTTTIDVLYGPEHEAMPQPLTRGHAHLVWWRHPEHGYGWTLFYWENDSPTAGIEDYFIPGDLTDVDAAVESARRWLDGLGGTFADDTD